MANRLDLTFKLKDVLHADEMNKIVSAINSIKEPTNTFGTDTEVTNPNEVAMGKYNKSNPGTTFSIGNGETSDRLNILEVVNTGDIYVTGLGGFAGNNSSTSQTLLTIIRENARRLGILEEGKVVDTPLTGTMEDIKPYEKDLQPNYIFLNNATNQFMMWNGHNWIILVNNDTKTTPAPKVTFDASPMLQAVLTENTGNHKVTEEFLTNLINAIDLGIVIQIKDIKDNGDINIINVTYAMNDISSNEVHLILYGVNNMTQLIADKSTYDVKVYQNDFSNPENNGIYYVKLNGKWVDINNALGFVLEAVDDINKEVI